MNAISRSDIVNWSEIARPHFESECALREHGGVRGATIQRLRASKLQADQKLLVQGRTGGREWVDGTDEHEGNAEYEALKRLQDSASQYRNARDRSWEQIRSAVDPLGLCTDDHVCEHLFGDGNSEHRNRPYYLTGFIEGALATWEQLALEVEAEHPAMDSSTVQDAADVVPAITTQVPLSESPRSRPMLILVRPIREAAKDIYTNAREWLARNFPVDYHQT
jgi:hypothetical protein